MTEYIEHLRDEYFEELYELPANSPDYCLKQGELVEEIAGEDRGVKNDSRISETDAMDVARLLNRGKVEEAEEELVQLLEE